MSSVIDIDNHSEMIIGWTYRVHIAKVVLNQMKYKILCVH